MVNKDDKIELAIIKVQESELVGENDIARI